MITGYVPTGRKPNSWVGNITNKSDYKVLVSSGLGWVMFPDLPLSWEECAMILEVLNGEKEKEIE